MSILDIEKSDREEYSKQSNRLFQYETIHGNIGVYAYPLIDSVSLFRSAWEMNERIEYKAPVNKLLTYGSPERDHDWPDYLELGFSQVHIPELITMLTDESLHRAESTSDAIWAPLHAWRILGRLRAVEAIPALLGQLFRIDEYDDDWVGDELPEVFAMIGAPALPELTEYLADSSHMLFARVGAAACLVNIGKQHPDSCHSCIIAIEEQLKLYRRNDPTLNGHLVNSLVELDAVEALPTIRKAYHHKCVDQIVLGDLEDAEIELGVRYDRATPPSSSLLGEIENAMKSSASTSSLSSEQTSDLDGKKKAGRNDPCPCGSGRKYKKCCLNR